MTITTTTTTRFNWLEVLKADVTKVRLPHILELREACDDMDFRLDDHIGWGGTTRHPIVTDTIAGFMSPQQKHLLDLWAVHASEDGRIINIGEAKNDTDAVSKLTTEIIKDSYAIRTARYTFSTNKGAYDHYIDMTNWLTEWNTFWTTKYPNKPNPGFQIVVIPAITSIVTGAGATDYNKILQSIEKITRINDVAFLVHVNVCGYAGNVIHDYSCNAWTNFTFQVLGASKNMFRDDGTVRGPI